MATQFVTRDYNDFKLLAHHFKPERPDVFYCNIPFDGVSHPPGADSFHAWAFNYVRGLAFYFLVENGASPGTPDDPMPSTFLTDFPQAVALATIPQAVNFF